MAGKRYKRCAVTVLRFFFCGQYRTYTRAAFIVFFFLSRMACQILRCIGLPPTLESAKAVKRLKRGFAKVAYVGSCKSAWCGFCRRTRTESLKMSIYETTLRKFDRVRNHSRKEGFYCVDVFEEMGKSKLLKTCEKYLLRFLYTPRFSFSCMYFV